MSARPRSPRRCTALYVCRSLWVAGALHLSGLAPVDAEPAPALRLETIDGFITELNRTNELDIGNVGAIATFVFSALPDRVKVYPTENYYYFRFVQNGVAYAGNFRLDPVDRDAGALHFAYYEELAPWKTDGPEYYRLLSAGNGFAVERIGNLVYRVTHNGKTVVFELNDLSHVRPPQEALHAGETYIGPIFDESGMRFFLLYNWTAKSFLYVLDETIRTVDTFDVAKGSKNILVGRRTGFAFYRDRRLERKFLIGVYEANALLNTYFDGPFDQLPENFIKGEDLRSAIVDFDASVKGVIDRLGHFPKGGRYAIHPYAHYRKIADLRGIDRCAARRREADNYYRCFLNPPKRK